jgi:hypothetical protein
MTSIPITSNNSTSTSGISCYPFIQIANSHVIANKALHQQSTNSNNTQNINTNSYVDYTESSAPFFDATNNPNLTPHSYPQPPAPAKTVAADSDFFSHYYNHNYQHVQYHNKNDTVNTSTANVNTSLMNNFYPAPSLPQHHSYNYPNYALTNKTNSELSDVLDRSTSMTSSGLNRYETTAFTSSICGLDFTNNLSYGGPIKNETDLKKLNNKGCNLMEYYGEKAGAIENLNGNGHETIGQMYNHQQDTITNNSKFKAKLNAPTRNASSSNNSRHSLFRFITVLTLLAQSQPTYCSESIMKN